MDPPSFLSLSLSLSRICKGLICIGRERRSREHKNMARFDLAQEIEEMEEGWCCCWKKKKEQREREQNKERGSKIQDDDDNGRRPGTTMGRSFRVPLEHFLPFCFCRSVPLLVSSVERNQGGTKRAVLSLAQKPFPIKVRSKRKGKKAINEYLSKGRKKKEHGMLSPFFTFCPHPSESQRRLFLSSFSIP